VRATCRPSRQAGSGCPRRGRWGRCRRGCSTVCDSKKSSFNVGSQRGAQPDRATSSRTKRQAVTIAAPNRLSDPRRRAPTQSAPTTTAQTRALGCFSLTWRSARTDLRVLVHVTAPSSAAARTVDAADTPKRPQPSSQRRNMSGAWPVGSKMRNRPHAPSSTTGTGRRQSAASRLSRLAVGVGARPLVPCEGNEPREPGQEHELPDGRGPRRDDQASPMRWSAVECAAMLSARACSSRALRASGAGAGGPGGGGGRSPRGRSRRPGSRCGAPRRGP
jgi:hypothetical protein